MLAAVFAAMLAVAMMAMALALALAMLALAMLAVAMLAAAAALAAAAVECAGGEAFFQPHDVELLHGETPSKKKTVKGNTQVKINTTLRIVHAAN